jgi:hypothetical protein
MDVAPVQLGQCDNWETNNAIELAKVGDAVAFGRPERNGGRGVRWTTRRCRSTDAPGCRERTKPHMRAHTMERGVKASV